MAKFVSPLLGYNNNVRHKNRVFHIQTEDSGVNHPHIITHLFMDGGRILKSVKTSYAEHLGTEKMNETVRQMMKDQHKAMFIALRDGQFDSLLDAGAKPAAKPAKPAEAVKPAEEEPAPRNPSAPPAAPAAPSTPPVAASSAEEAVPATVTDPTPPEPVAPAPAPAPPPVDPDATLEMAPASSPDGPFRALPSAIPPPSRDRLGIAAPAPPRVPRIATPGLGTAASALADTPSAPNAPPERRASPVPGAAPAKIPSVRDLTMDFDALEPPPSRDDGPLYRSNDLPPPPANLFAKGSGSGGYSEHDKRPVVVPREEPESPGTQPTARQSAKPEPARLSPTSLGVQQPSAAPAAPPRSPAPEPPKTEQRYAPARPASVFGAAGNRPTPASIFSDELISDKSLDEVILSYLAEDLEPPQRK